MTPVGHSKAALAATDADRPGPRPIRFHASRRDRLRAPFARALPALRGLAFVAAVAIVATMAVRAGRDVETRDFAWWPLPPAFGAAVAWWLLLARGWALLVSGHSGRRDVSAWCRTQALRYLPGGIWAPASRAVLVRGNVADKVSTVAAENVTALCAALSLAGVALAAARAFPWLLLALAIAAPPLASRLVAGRTRITPRRTLAATSSYLTGFFAYAFAAVLVQTAVSGVHEPLAVAGSAALAWSAGLVVVIAPGGLGVREFVYVAILSDTFPNAELVAAAVVLRLVTVFAELSVLVVAGRPTLEPGSR